MSNNNPSKMNWAALAALLIVTAIAFLMVPLDQTLPIHWNIRGEADRLAPAWLALLIAPVMGIAMLSLFTWLSGSRFKKDFQAGKHVIEVAASMMLLLFTGLELVLLVIGRGGEIDVPRLIALAFAALFLVLGNVLPKSQPNWIAGIRIPWTLNDDENWRVTHYWAGRLMMLGGVVLGVAALLGLSAPVLFAILVITAAVPIIIGIAISYKMAH